MVGAVCHLMPQRSLSIPAHVPWWTQLLLTVIQSFVYIILFGYSCPIVLNCLPVIFFKTYIKLHLSARNSALASGHRLNNKDFLLRQASFISIASEYTRHFCVPVSDQVMVIDHYSLQFTGICRCHASAQFEPICFLPYSNILSEQLLLHCKYCYLHFTSTTISIVIHV